MVRIHSQFIPQLQLTPRFYRGALKSTWIPYQWWLREKEKQTHHRSNSGPKMYSVLFGSVILSLFIFYRKNNYFIFVENSIKNESCPFQTNQSSIKLIFQINLILYSFIFCFLLFRLETPKDYDDVKLKCEWNDKLEIDPKCCSVSEMDGVVAPSCQDMIDFWRKNETLLVSNSLFDVTQSARGVEHPVNDNIIWWNWVEGDGENGIKEADYELQQLISIIIMIKSLRITAMKIKKS